MKVETNLNIVLDNILLALSPPKLSELLNTCAQSLYQSNMHRVFNEGKNINGTSIGRYSRKPTYVNPKNSPKSFTPAGKKNKGSSFENGKPRKTRYFPGGYMDYRNKVGRRIDIVDLHLTGGLQGDFQNKKLSSGIGNEIGFMSTKKGDIADRLENHFNCTIFGVTPKDIENVNAIITNYTNNLST